MSGGRRSTTASCPGAIDRRLWQWRLPLRRHVASRLDPGAAVGHQGLAGRRRRRADGRGLRARSSPKATRIELAAPRHRARHRGHSRAAFRARFREARDRPRRDADRRGRAHLQHPARREPQGRRGADRRAPDMADASASSNFAYAHCEALVREGDPDRYLATPVRARRQAAASSRALRLQLRDRPRPRIRARGDARRDPPAMVARRPAGRGAGRRAGQSGRGRARRHHRPVPPAAAGARRPDRCPRSSISTTIRCRP